MAIAFVALFSGCTAATVYMTHKDLDVKTQMSNTIFLEPVASVQKTIWVDFKNTSDQQMDLLGRLKSELEHRGFVLVSDPNKGAHYRLQGNLLYVGKTSISAAQMTMMNGFGGGLAGMAVGGAVGSSTGSLMGTWVGAGIGGLAGAGLEIFANSMVKNVTFVAVMDLQVSEFSEKVISQRETGNLSQGNQSAVLQSGDSSTHWKRYRVRVVSTANQVNLEFPEAVPALTDSLVKSIAGIF